MRRIRNATPYWITAKFPGECGCGAVIKKGDWAMYFPNGKAVECASCGAKTQGLLDDERMMEAQHGETY